MLFNITTPLTTGFNSYLGNIGSLRNKGWELELTGHILSGPFKWTETVNFSHNTNKVLDMGEISKFVSEQWPDMFSITQVGEAIGQYYGYKTNGVLTADDFDADGKALVPIISGQREGNAKYVDISGPDGVPDGKITAADYTVLGSNMPNLMYGITTKLEWKNFDLSIFIQGQSGGKVCFLGSRQYDEGGMNYRVFSHWLNCYKPDYERLYGAGNDPIPYDYCKQHGIDMESWDGKTVNFRGNNQNRDDRRLYSATYWRLKNITLGYTFPRKYLEAMRFIKSLRLYASADNLYTHSNYPGFTPETNSFGNNTVFQGFDYSSYPLSRRVIFGVNVTF
ncbi:MAG: TonB-dependent receptor [Prevotella sp.]|nr:TonB-dependent receptor [Prevotella sp.]